MYKRQGLTLRQQPGGSYKISVRTTDKVDACAIAKRLGGGGHVRAAGCELMGNLDNAKAAVLALDGIAVVVNPANTTEDLTVDQIKGIYTGELTTWADVQ